MIRPRRDTVDPAGLASLDENATAGRDRWLLSYGDFMTLLLALFVVLYASARIDAQKRLGVVEGIQAALLVEPSTRTSTSDPLRADMSSVALRSPEIDPLAGIEKDLTRVLSRQRREFGEELGTTLLRSERGLVISLASTEFFPAGGVAIPEERKQVLGALAPILAAHSGAIQFEGHTDDQPIASESYPSNWELSAARAAAIARYFIEEHQIDARQIATTGYAEFRPIVTNRSAADRARNRRVEIVVLEDAALVASDPDGPSRDELDRLLEALPPIPERADESLKPDASVPVPLDIPLP